MKRSALTFTVRQGSEERVSAILSGYGRPAVQVDGETRLLRTSVFLGGNRVVRVVDVDGDLPTALRHLASQPAVQEVERELNDFLEHPRELGDPQAARAFFARALLPPAGRTAPGADGDDSRAAVLWSLPPAEAQLAATALLALEDGAPTSTVFTREDVLVWLLEGDGAPEDLLARAGRTLAASADRPGLAALDVDRASAAAATSALTARSMRLLTDRRAGVPA